MSLTLGRTSLAHGESSVDIRFCCAVCMLFSVPGWVTFLVSIYVSTVICGHYRYTFQPSFYMIRYVLQHQII